MANEIEVAVSGRESVTKAFSAVEIKSREMKAKVSRDIDELNAKKLKIDADVLGAEARIKRLRKQAEEATDDRKLKIEADIAAAEAKLKVLRNRSQDISGRVHRLRIGADTAQADAALVTTGRLVSRLDGRTARVRVDADVAAAMTKIAAVGAALAGLGAGGLALGGIGAAVGAVGAGGLAVGLGAMGGIGDAVRALGAPQGGGGGGGGGGSDQAARARQIERANQQVRRSEIDLKNAQLDSRRAQEELTSARKDAARQLEDLQRQTEDMALSQERAALDVEQAMRDRNAVMNDRTSTDLQRRQADLAYREALQQQKDLGTQAKQLAAEKAEADRKGVEGSDQVVAAQDRVREANQRVVDAAEDLKNAQQDALAATKETGSSGGASISKLAQAMADLTPEGQRFAKFLRGFIDGPLKDVRNAAQAGFLPGIQSGLEQLVPIMPEIAKAVGGFAKSLGSALGAIIPIVGKLSVPFLNFAKSALDGLKPLGPVLDEFVSSLGAMFDQMAKDGTAKELAGLFVELLRAILPLVPALLELAIQVGKVFGPKVVDLMQTSADLMITYVIPAFEQFATMLSENGDAMNVFIGLLTVATAALLGLGGPVLLVVAGIIALGVGLKAAWDHSEKFREGVEILGHALDVGLRVALETLMEVWNENLLPALRWAWSYIVKNVKPAFDALRKAIGDNGPELRRVAAWVGELLKSWVKLQGFVGGALIKSLGVFIGWLGSTFLGGIRTAVDAVGSLVRAWDRVRGAINDARNAASGAMDTIGGFFGSVGGWFAHGGIVGAATGGARGNMVMVGEHGRELVRLPFGSQVHSNPDTERMLSAGAGSGGRLQVEWVGGNASDELMTWLRKNIRVRGGNVQSVLGS